MAKKTTKPDYLAQAEKAVDEKYSAYLDAEKAEKDANERTTAARVEWRKSLEELKAAMIMADSLLPQATMVFYRSGKIVWSTKVAVIGKTPAGKIAVRKVGVEDNKENRMYFVIRDGRYQIRMDDGYTSSLYVLKDIPEQFLTISQHERGNEK